MEELSKGLQRIFLLVLIIPIFAFFGLITRIQELGGAKKTAKDYIYEKIKAFKG
tara:strand:+ start:43 stop:204 length:162 start_codon:yes stop_codon:yes gene_type:complete